MMIVLCSASLLTASTAYKTVITGSDRPGSVSMLGDNRHEGSCGLAGFVIALRTQQVCTDYITNRAWQSMAEHGRDMVMKSITLCRTVGQ